MNKKNQPTRRQTVAVAAKRGHGERIRKWMYDMEVAAGIRRSARKPKRAERGTDRVPARLLGLAPTYEVLHRGGTYRNPDRIARLAKSGRLRKELRG